MSLDFSKLSPVKLEIYPPALKILHPDISFTLNEGARLKKVLMRCEL